MLKASVKLFPLNILWKISYSKVELKFTNSGDLCNIFKKRVRAQIQKRILKVLLKVKLNKVISPSL